MQATLGPYWGEGSGVQMKQHLNFKKMKCKGQFLLQKGDSKKSSGMNSIRGKMQYFVQNSEHS